MLYYTVAMHFGGSAEYIKARRVRVEVRSARDVVLVPRRVPRVEREVGVNTGHRPGVIHEQLERNFYSLYC